jgi:transcriptional regulator with XRE-family HTH domain
LQDKREGSRENKKIERKRKKMIRERVIELLGAGVTQSQVAAALGVEESYVSQLMSEEEVRAEVSNLRATKAAGYIQVDGTIENLEEVALERITRLLPMEANLMKALKVFQVMNAAKKKSESSIAPQQPANIVTINLPQQALVTFQMSSDKQVIDIAGRSLTTMPSHQLQARLKERQAATLLADQTPAIDPKLAARLAQF